MACSCHHNRPLEEPAHTGQEQPGWRRVLWIALVVNAAFFGIELVAGLRSGSVSLLADAVDFGGDAANYALSLAVLSLAAVWRSRAAWVKGLCMALYGLFVLGQGGWSAWQGRVPEPLTMGVVGFLALLANTGVAVMLYRFRQGDANMRSVWLCSRNDALSNLAVLLAAAGVFGTGNAWPDWLVAAIMATLGLSAGWSVLRHARQELRAAAQQARGGTSGGDAVSSAP